MPGEHKFEQPFIKCQGALVDILGRQLSITMEIYMCFSVVGRT
jgi:hypothetical protein